MAPCGCHKRQFQEHRELSRKYGDVKGCRRPGGIEQDSIAEEAKVKDREWGALEKVVMEICRGVM